MASWKRRSLGRSDVRVTPLGLGTAPLGNLFTPVADLEASATIAAALAGGVAFIDTAPYYGYGLAEKRVGEALAEDPRSDIVLSTKVGRLLVPRSGAPRDDQGFVAALRFDPVFDYSYDGVMRSVEESLVRLGVGHIDVLLLHDIGALTHGDDHARVFDLAMESGYRALDELRRAGDVGAIGIGVNECEVLCEALKRGDFDCFLLAGRYTLLEQGALDQLLPLCASTDTSVIVGGPFNSGVLAGEMDGASHYDYQAAAPEILDRARALREVCRAHAIPITSAALQFPLHHPAVAAVIPGARTAAEVEANISAFGREIPHGLWRDLVAEGLLDPRAPVEAEYA